MEKACLEDCGFLYFNYDINNTCLKCDLSCNKDCLGPTPFECSLCNGTKKYYRGECLENCPSNATALIFD